MHKPELNDTLDCRLVSQRVNSSRTSDDDATLIDQVDLTPATFELR